MEKRYEVRVTPYAQRQILDIARYISAALQAPEAAENWLAVMEQELESLSFMPARIPLTPEKPWCSRGIHRMIVKNFFVYFWIETEKSRVWITAVVYARRSQKQQLKKIDFSGAKFFTYDEGLCVQCLHIGPYDDEPATIENMDAFARQQGYLSDMEGIRYHHEIYLSDVRKCKPENLKTVIRHPVKAGM